MYPYPVVFGCIQEYPGVVVSSVVVVVVVVVLVVVAVMVLVDVVVAVVDCFASRGTPDSPRSTHRLPTENCPACPPQLANEAPPRSICLNLLIHLEDELNRVWLILEDNLT